MMDTTWLISGSVKYVCFAVFGALTAHHVSDDPLVIAGGAIAGIVLSVAGSLVIDWLLYTFDQVTRAQHGIIDIDRVVNAGFTMLVPFAVLALIAELALDWNAAQVFTTAGIMTSGATMSTTLAGEGKRSFFAALLPGGGAVILVVAWVLLSLGAGKWLG